MTENGYSTIQENGRLKEEEDIKSFIKENWSEEKIENLSGSFANT